MSITDAGKSKRGRPAVNATPITLRMPPDQLAALDAWITAQDDVPSRPEAIRRILVERLAK